MGGNADIFRVSVNDSWAVTSNAYSIMPENKGMITMELRVENKKKYMITIHYTTNAELKINAAIQYSSDKEKDYTTNVTQEIMDFYPAKNNGGGTFSFIISPELTSTATLPAAGYPTSTSIALTVPTIKIKEAGKSGMDYTFRYMGMDVKEIQ
jgi:hypothetical protein